MRSKFWASKLKSELMNNHAKDSSSRKMKNQKAGCTKRSELYRTTDMLNMLYHNPRLPLTHPSATRGFHHGSLARFSHSRHATTLIISFLGTSPCQPLNLLLV